MLFERAERTSYPLHLVPRGDGYALMTDTPNGARIDLLENGPNDWPSALERFLEEQVNRGVEGVITSANGAVLREVHVDDPITHPHLDTDHPIASIELYQDTSQPALFPELMASPYRVMLTTSKKRVDLLPERSRNSYLAAHALMLEAHEATGLPAFVTDVGGHRVRAMNAKRTHASRRF